MDSQGSSGAPPPPQPPHHHQQPPLQRHHQHPQSIMVGPPHHQSHPQQPTPLQHPNSYSFHSPVTVNNIMPHQHHQQQQQQHQQHQQQQQSSRFPFNSMMTASPAPKMQTDYSDGGGGGVAMSAETGGGASGFSADTAKKKRGRPRKYSPDGTGSSIALGLSPTTPVSNTVAAATDSSGGGGADALSSEGPAKKHRGRPPGSGKKQLDALGTPGVGFTPHVITVKAGEDIASKLMAFSQQGPRTVCILSANGAICNVTLRQPATSGGTVTYEGRFEIISLSGSFLLSEDGGGHNRTSGLSVSLAGSDGRVLGGGVAGMLMAASPVQIIVGSFIQDGKKPKSVPAISPAPNMLSFGNATIEASPPPQGRSSDSSDDNGSPMNQGAYMNAGQPMQNVQMYTNMGWGTQR